MAWCFHGINSVCESGSLEGFLSAVECGGVCVDNAGFQRQLLSFFRGAKGPLNPRLYPAAAMLHFRMRYRRVLKLILF